MGDYKQGDYLRGLEYRNITFYTGSVTGGEASVNNLRSLIEDYEGIMASGSVYTNMASAYKAYVDANEAYDAAVYGNNTSKVSDAYSALSSAIANMKTWTPATFTAKSYHYDDEAVNGYSNVVYATSGDSGMFEPDDYTEPGATYVKLFLPKITVLVYDGKNEVSSPIVAETKQHDKAAVSKQKICYIASPNDTVYFDQTWKGYTETDWKKWPTTTTNQFGSLTSHGTSYMFDTTNKNTPRFWRNKLVYHGTGNSANYYETFSNFNFSSYAYYSNWGDKYGSKSIATTFTNYVINYKPIISDVNTLKSRLSAVDVSNYKEGGLSSIMIAFDAYTSDSVNPNKYAYSNVSSDVSACATEIKNAHNNYASETVGAADNANNYIKLRSYLTDGLSGTFDFGNGNVTLTAKQIFEDSAYNADNLANYGDSTTGFYKAYLDAVNHMAALPATTSASDYDGSTAASLATALKNAFDLLSVKAPIDPPTFTGQAYIGSTNTITINNPSVADGATVHYSIEYTKTDNTKVTENGTFSTASKDITLFAANASSVIYKSAQITAYAEKNNSPTDNVTASYTYLPAPTIINDHTSAALEDNTVFVNYTVSVTSNSTAPNPTFEYSFNGSAWYPMPAHLNPFGSGAAQGDSPAYDNSNLDKVTLYVREKYNISFETTSKRIINRATAPTITAASEYVDENHGFTVNDRDTVHGTLKFELSTDNSNWVEFDYNNELDNGIIKPFNIISPASSQTVYVKARSYRNGDYSEYSDIKTFHYLSRPAVTFGGSALADNAIVADDGTITVTNTSGATDGLKYSIDGGSTWTAIANGASFSPFTLNSTATKLSVQVKQEKDGSTSPIYSATIYNKPTAPTIISENEFLDKTHGVTASLQDGSDNTASTLEISTDGSAFTAYTGKVYPFSGVTDENSRPTITYYARAKRVIDGVTAYSDVVDTGTLYYLSQPRIMDASGLSDITANQALLESDTVTLHPQSGHLGDLKYSYDGVSWSDYSAAIAPFAANSTKLSVTIYAKQVSGACESAVYSIKVVKNDTFYIYSYTSGKTPQYSSREFSNSSKLFVSTTAVVADDITKYGANSKYLDSIYYKVTVDGEPDDTLYHYDNDGIDIATHTSGEYTAPDLTGASVVKIQAFIVEDDGSGGLVSCREYATQTFFNTVNYSEDVMHESFNNASVSGTTLTLSDRSTATLLGGAGTASIVEGAGYVDGNKNSPDWRNNVLKINANSTAPGNSIQFTNNPLADPKAAAAANTSGVTISFWRYLEKDGVCANLGTSGDPTGYPWRNAIAFDDAWQNHEGYYLIEVNGTNSRCVTNNLDYYDYAQENQDPTGHAAGNARGNWVNVVITIDPNSGVMLYTNGEPHKMKAGYPKKIGTTFSGKSDAVVAQEILEFITSNTTRLLFNYGEVKEGNDFDMYLDDVRIYTGVKSQVDINNMYISSDADVVSDLTSTSHDPTNVTVYTLKHDVTYTAYSEANAAKSITIPAGTTVGQEVIDYCSLSPIPGGADVSAVDEYSFGTGMTIYHKNKSNGKWEVVGDDQGRCGYQNQKLFGGDYETTLNEALSYAAEDDKVGAGKLVWAPHVMFNLFNAKWTYYGSASSWSSQHSAIFVCDGAENGSIEGPYTYRQVVYKSNGHPNAIDPCCYYAYDGNNKPITNNVYMAFGSWGGENCIALKTLYADGDGNNFTTAFDDNSTKYLCHGINSTLEGASDGSSGEGAYITYENGYYYLYVSYGQNTGSYLERVFRSSSPTGGFAGYNEVAALDNETHKTHGGQVLAPFDLSNYDYTMVSTGHNSVYKTVNNYGQVVTVNSAHARPLANADHSWQALPDGALATRQSEVTGNINLLNQVAYNEDGWPVFMPFQYTGNDKVKFADGEITAEKIEGIYGANDLQNTEYYNYAKEYMYTIIKDETDPMLAYEYGTDGSGAVFKDYIRLTRVTEGPNTGTVYATYYTDKNDMAGSTLYKGVVGTHNGQICISMVCTEDYEYTWTYRISEIPKTEDVDALGDSVSMDGVLYTHKPKDSYAMYGREISCDFDYGKSSLHQGERCTTVTTTYPAKIDLSDPAAIYCLSDEELCKTGEYAGGDYSLTALNDNKWYDKAGNKYTDAEAIARNGLGTGGASDKLKHLYGVTGYVSDYYFDADSGKYRDKGVTLIIGYTDITSGKNYSEFEFCYVMANPAMAHTIQGIRNQSKDGTSRKASQLLYDRFQGSYGHASGIISEVSKQSAVNAGSSSTGEPIMHGTGVFNYAGTWGNSESVSASYDSPSAMASKFNFFESNVGINSGSYGMIEHNDTGENSFSVSSNVVDTDYYVDYSNTDNYKSNNPYGLITVNGSGKPTGYSFDFKTSNIKWVGDNEADFRWGTTSYMLTTGDAKTKLTLDSTYDSSKDSFVKGIASDTTRYSYGNYTDSEMTALGYTDTEFKISGTGDYCTNSSHGSASTSNRNNLPNAHTLGLYNDDLKKVVNGYFYNSSEYDAAYPSNDNYTAGLTRALPVVNAGRTDTNAWNMHITFTGKQSVAKNSDPGDKETYRAEKYANFILEQGVIVQPATYADVFGAYIVVARYVICEESYAYYNIGVHTCDKGAARAFADNYLRKKLAVTKNPNGSVSVKKNATTGAPIYLDENGDETTNVDEAAIINPQAFTLKSYQDYIDAVAELNWFVNNPTNTTFKDYANSGSNASTEYTTAYTAGGSPIYNTTTAGDNIFDENVNTVHTDSVQAMLINNVITAYENLFEQADYKNAADEYATVKLFDGDTESSTIANVDKITITPTEGEAQIYTKDNFTDDSWNSFVTLIVNVSSAFNYKCGESVSPKDKDSWRHVNLSGAEYRNLLNILKSADDTLLESVDIESLTTTYNTKHGNDAAGSATGTATGGIFTSTAKTVSGTEFAAGQQVYTFASWNTLNSECVKANAYLTVGNAKYARNQSKTISGANVVNKGDNEPDFSYKQGKYKVTGVTKYTFDGINFYARTIDKTQRSDEQLEVDGENTALGGLSLVVVDTPDCYNTYDSAKTIVDTLDMDKYTAAGQEIITNASTTTNNAVYHTLNSDEATAYNAAVTGASLAAGDKLRQTTTGQTDPQSSALMTAINNVNGTKENGEYKYIKYFKVTFSKEYSDTELYMDSEVHKVMYGDPITVSIDSSDKIVNWGISIYDGEYADDFSEKPRASQKVSSVMGGSLTRIANNNMAIVAEVEQSSVPNGKIQFNILDAYGKLNDVTYGASLTRNGDAITSSTTIDNLEYPLLIDGSEISLKAVPFYTQTGWTITKKSNTLFTIRPIYSVADVYNITVIDDGTHTDYERKYDSKYYLNVSEKNSAKFAAWAVKKGDMYQIASYSKSYMFYVCANETYVPIINVGTAEAPSYKTAEGVAITSSNIDGVITKTGALNADAFVTNKIKEHYPFVSVENAKMSTKDTVNGNLRYTKARLFVRITEGSDAKLSSYGVLFFNGNNSAENMVIDGDGVYRRAVTNKLETGQFTYTLSNTKNGFSQNVTFRAYVNYDFDYTAGGTTASINGLDYSDIAIATV
ncbi:MAG: family 43 glycosylhydrolase [Eubacterium sp.]|nr:family 43 glycosylhydrolase [Eubacterium sp.]